MKHASLILIMNILWLTPVWSQDDWELAKEKNGISVYTRKTEQIDFKEFKGITYIDNSVSSFLAVITDVDNLTDWVYSVINAKLLEKSSDTLMIYYAESKVPWPFDNRDAVYRDKVSWDADKRVLTIDIKCLPGYIEKNEDIVRIPFAKGHWRVEELEKNRIKVEFQMLVDPGGTIPAWLANAFVVDSPFETLEGLREVIKDRKYENVKYDFIF